MDYVKIFARSGHGGAGSAHTSVVRSSWPSGVRTAATAARGQRRAGGRQTVLTLIHLKYQRHQFAEDGENGSGARSSGWMRRTS